MKTRLERVIKKGQIIENAPMKEHTSFKAGGNANLLVIPETMEELEKAVEILADSEYMVMGNGSNILVKDGGYKGTILKISRCCNEIVGDGPVFEIGAAVLLSAAARHVQSMGYSGLEFASGIPGSIGGAAFMNAGAYDGEMKNIIKAVFLLKKDGSGSYALPVSQMEYGYRHSVLYDTGDIVTGISIELAPGNKEDIAKKMKELNERRNAKQPVNYPSAGSFFKRPEGYFAGKLVQDAGLKGLTVGGAQVSELHSGFVINIGNATATDIVQLMHLVQASVKEQFGVMLEPEVRIIGEN